MRANRVVAEYEVWLDGAVFPFPRVKAKVIEQGSKKYVTRLNVTILNKCSREPEYLSGLGSTIDEAMQDLLTRFEHEARSQDPKAGLTEADFEWSSPHDF